MNSMSLPIDSRMGGVTKWELAAQNKIANNIPSAKVTARERP